MTRINLPVVLEGISTNILRGGQRFYEIRSPHVGYYYPAPEVGDRRGFLLPYKQTGGAVQAGEVLCRIRALTHKRIGRWTPNFEIVVQDYVVTSPVHGILRTRCAEDIWWANEKVPSLGNQEFAVMHDGFSVEYHELLFVLQAANT